jgi:hypothetical protein
MLLLALHAYSACAGHSTNFIMHLPLPCSEHPTKWVKSGLALLCQLDD